MFRRAFFQIDGKAITVPSGVAVMGGTRRRLDGWNDREQELGTEGD